MSLEAVPGSRRSLALLRYIADLYTPILPPTLLRILLPRFTSSGAADEGFKEFESGLGSSD